MNAFLNRPDLIIGSLLLELQCNICSLCVSPFPPPLQTMDQRVGLFFLLAAGLLCLTLVPVSRAEDVVEDGLDDDVDVEDELDLGLAGAEEEEELEGDVQDEAPATPKTPPTPKVRLQPLMYKVRH